MQQHGNQRSAFLASVVPGQGIVVEGRIVHVESVVAFGEAEATLRATGAVVAEARVTFAIQQERV